ncbi:hypothetical protein VTH8203_03562 [Vibrio thalassae]|uniref:Uncharacterized protein n=1 Tax=Vibrio thalassae TaxID=1243014 RepID=A0A240EMT3_9VIBR|nr:hypothetical protein VTH8203_03562 [Vibrio thalassae]
MPEPVAFIAAGAIANTSSALAESKKVLAISALALLMPVTLRSVAATFAAISVNGDTVTLSRRAISGNTVVSVPLLSEIPVASSM